MRVWVDPQKAAEHGLTASDIVKAIQTQNVEAAAIALTPEERAELDALPAPVGGRY